MADDPSAAVPTSSAIPNLPRPVPEDESADSALTVLSNMDECWFWGNIVIRGVRNAPPAVPLPRRGMEMISPTVDAAPDLHMTAGDGDGTEFSEIFHAKSVQEKGRRRSLSDMEAAHLTFDPHWWDSSGLASEKNGGRPTERCNNTVDSAIVAIAETPGPPSAIKEVQHSDITRPPKLASIPSGKLLADDDLAPAIMDSGAPRARLRRRERRRTSKSMTDLEFDELKGFMELGFRFDKGELSPQIVNVLPALQRLAGHGKIHTPAASRPYLSEAWLIRRSDSPLLNWRMPRLKDQGVDMKEHLKFWARAVASTVQQES